MEAVTKEDLGQDYDRVRDLVQQGPVWVVGDDMVLVSRREFERMRPETRSVTVETVGPDHWIAKEIEKQLEEMKDIEAADMEEWPPR